MKRVRNSFTPATINGSRFLHTACKFLDLFGHFLKERGREKGGREGGGERERERTSSEGTLPNFIQ